MDLAVAAAKKAFHRYSQWRTMDASQRGLLLLKLADLLESQARYLAELETLDCGKPVKQSEEEIYFSASVLRYYAGKADKILGNTIPAGLTMFKLPPFTPSRRRPSSTPATSTQIQRKFSSVSVLPTSTQRRHDFSNIFRKPTSC